MAGDPSKLRRDIRAASRASSRLSEDSPPPPPEAAPPLLPGIISDLIGQASGSGDDLRDMESHGHGFVANGTLCLSSATVVALAEAISTSVAHKLAECLSNAVEAKLDQILPKYRSGRDDQSETSAKRVLQVSTSFTKQVSAGSKVSALDQYKRTVTELQEHIDDRILLRSRERGAGIPSPSGQRAPGVQGHGDPKGPHPSCRESLQNGGGPWGSHRGPQPGGPVGRGAPRGHDQEVDVQALETGETGVREVDGFWSGEGQDGAPSSVLSNFVEEERSQSKIMTNAEMMRWRVDELMEVVPSSGAERTESPCREEGETRCEKLLLLCFRAGGVLAWGQESCARFSAIYKCFVLLLTIAAFTSMLSGVAGAWQKGYSSPEPLCEMPQLAPEQQTSMLSNIPVAGGAVAVFASLASVQGRSRLDEVLPVLLLQAGQHEVRQLWMRAVKRDIAFMLVVFVCTNLAIFRGVEGSAWSAPGQTAAPALHRAMLSISTSLLMLLILFFLFVLRLLIVTVDVFCFRLVENLHLSEAIDNWNVLQALLRKASGALELGLLLFLAVGALTIPALVLDHTLLGFCVSTVRLQLPHIFVLCAVLWMFITAAVVTGKCIRVPALVNSLSFGPGVEGQRYHLVMYILNSAAGFYIFNVRLTTGMVAKFMYVWAVVVFGVVSRSI